MDQTHVKNQMTRFWGERELGRYGWTVGATFFIAAFVLGLLNLTSAVKAEAMGVLDSCMPLNKIGKEARDELFAKMRDSGGYIILVRHGWPGEETRVKPEHLKKNCLKNKDNLTRFGRHQARMVGRGLLAAAREPIKVAAAYASPKCRTTDTARIILNQLPNPNDATLVPDNNLKKNDALNSFFSGLQLPPKGNVLVVSHSTFINGFIGQLIGKKPKNIEFSCAEAAVLKPIQTKGKSTAFKCMARILPEEWKEPDAGVSAWLKKAESERLSRCATKSAYKLRK